MGEGAYRKHRLWTKLQALNSNLITVFKISRLVDK